MISILQMWPRTFFNNGVRGVCGQEAEAEAVYVIGPCRTCSNRWYGNADKTMNFAQFYCARRGDVRRKDMKLIGSDADLKGAVGCKDHKL